MQRMAAISAVRCPFWFKEKVEKKRKCIRNEQMKPGPEEEIFDFFVIFSFSPTLTVSNLLNFLKYEQRTFRKKVVDRHVGFIDVPE